MAKKILRDQLLRIILQMNLKKRIVDARDVPLVEDYKKVSSPISDIILTLTVCVWAASSPCVSGSTACQDWGRDHKRGCGGS